MYKRLFSIIVMAGFLLIGMTVFAKDTNVRVVKPSTMAINGKITNIKGNVITITDSSGKIRKIEIKSVEGLKVGDSAICEEDCGRQIRIGNEVINVQRIIR